MKIAIVTGASTGIGKATAIRLAKDEFKILLVARSEEKLFAVKKEIEAKGGKAEVHTVDLNNLDSISDFISKIKSSYSEINALINIAGIWHNQDEAFAGIDFSEFDQNIILQTYNVGLIAPTLLVHGLTPLMPKGSKIVNLSGTFENGGKGWLPYFVSKKALEDFTFGLADELKEKEIYVNCISPSDTATEEYSRFFPEYIDEALSPEHVAEEISKLCKEENETTGTSKVIKKYIYNQNDINFLKKSIEKSKESFEKGYFPAGSLVVKGDKVISEEISSPYPDHRHADSKAVDNAFDQIRKPLENCTLYCSMEPCLMCICRAYWAGIRRIVYAIKKESLPKEYFESNHSNNELLERFNEKIEFVHVEELENEALVLVNQWRVNCKINTKSK